VKALRFSKFGPPSVLAIEEILRPEARAGEALVQVKAAAINPSDVKNRGSLPGNNFAAHSVPRFFRHCRDRDKVPRAAGVV
jgi:NADPH:quinone reductase-like Zn-dependent oxidoreductase